MAKKTAEQKRATRLEQIKKVMKRATDPRANPSQAENDLLVATRLMSTYGIEPEELEESDGGFSRKEGIDNFSLEVSNRNFAGLMRRDALGMIGAAFGARPVFYRQCTPGGNTRGYRIDFYATASVAETLRAVLPTLAEWAENRLAAELADKRAQLRECPWKTTRDQQREADQWAKGWWHAFGAATARKVRAVRNHSMDDHLGSSGKGELVRQSDADRLDAFLKQHFTKLRTASASRTRYDHEAVAKGTQAGREALIGQDEVTQDGEERPILT